MIDTASKRWAMLGFGMPGRALPVPDGSFEAFDRMALLGGYYQTPLDVISGPFFCRALDGHQPGAAALDTHQPGASAADAI